MPNGTGGRNASVSVFSIGFYFVLPWDHRTCVRALAVQKKIGSIFRAKLSYISNEGYIVTRKSSTLTAKTGRDCTICMLWVI